MSKDPAFLFYSKDWLEGTAEMLPEEKGVYIDLLCHQHQKGSLPLDTKRLSRLVGLTENEFLKIWDALKPKFNQEGDRLVNRKLDQIATERQEKGNRNKIIGTFAAVIKLNKSPEEVKQKIKKAFNYEDFIQTPTNVLTERLTEWVNEWITTAIEDVDVDENENVVKEEKEGVEGKEGLDPNDFSQEYPSAYERIKAKHENQKKNYKTITMPFNGSFAKIWDEWKEYKAIQHDFKYKSAGSEQAALHELVSLAFGKEDTAIAIIKQSMAKGWKGFFQVKIDNNVKSRQQTGGFSKEGLQAEFNRRYSDGK